MDDDEVEPSAPTGGPGVSVVRTIRVDADAWEVLEWWASEVGLPLRSVIRQALEDTADEILAAFVAELDPELPPSVLLKRVAYRLELPRRATSGMRSEAAQPQSDNPST